METPFGTETPHSTVVEAVETVMIDDEMRELEICVDRYRNSSEFTFYTLLFMNEPFICSDNRPATKCCRLAISVPNEKEKNIRAKLK